MLGTAGRQALTSLLGMFAQGHLRAAKLRLSFYIGANLSGTQTGGADVMDAATGGQRLAIRLGLREPGQERSLLGREPWARNSCRSAIGRCDALKLFS